MSLEKELKANTEAARANTEAMGRLIQALGVAAQVTTIPEGIAEMAVRAIHKASVKPPKEVNEEVNSALDSAALAIEVVAAKAKGSELLLKLAGKSPEAAKELLSHFGVTKFSQLKPGINVFQDFAKRCGDKLATLLHEATYKSIVPGAEGEDKVQALADHAQVFSDGMANLETVSPSEYTVEDVRKVIIALCNNPELGRDGAEKALATAGVDRITELSADQFATVINAGDKLLAGGKLNA